MCQMPPCKGACQNAGIHCMLVVLAVFRLSSAGIGNCQIGCLACTFWNTIVALQYSTCRSNCAYKFCFVKFDMLEDSTDPNNPHVFCFCYQLIDIDAMSSVAF